MTTYCGPATVTTPDSTIIEVTATLAGRTDQGRADWHGTLTAPGTVLLDVHEGQLRVPNGHESGFIRTAGGMPGGPIRVEGSSGERLL